MVPALQQRLLAWIRGEERGFASFEEAAREVFAWQFAQNRPYRRYCEALGRGPGNIGDWREIPALPTDAFKESRHRPCGFLSEESIKFFLTSGTTQEVKGRHDFRDLALYETSVLQGWKELGLPEIRNPWFFSLPPEAAPSSSLTHMFGVLSGGKTDRWMLDAAGNADLSGLAAQSGEVALFSTAIGLLRLMEEHPPLLLPEGSWIFETGGYKGLSVSLEPEDFRARVGEFFGISPSRVLNEYSMTELSSQFYRWPDERAHRGPFWTRIRVVNPETGLPAAKGEAGYLEIVDLANLDSVAAIRTQDLALAVGDSEFVLLGRDPGALPRGCSRGTDDLHASRKRGELAVEVGHSGKKSVWVSDRCVLATRERIGLLAAQAEVLAPWLGDFDAELLENWLRDELGDAGALDGWVQRGPVKSRAVAFSPVLHVVSGNTPHAAFQSVFRGLLLGGKQWVKLPSAGLPEFEQWLASLPEALSNRIEARHDLPDAWLEPEAAVIFGGVETLEFFRSRLPMDVPRIEHGPKLSIAVIFEPSEEAAWLLAEDILRFEQRGCLSVQAVYLDALEEQIRKFGDRLAQAMQVDRAKNPRPHPLLSDSGRVTNFREIFRYRQANGEPSQLWESHGSTDWTIVFNADPRLEPGPLNGTVVLRPLPAPLNREVLGEESAYLSTAAIYPFTEESAERLDTLSPPRICAVGKAQCPTIFWKHDGMSPLNALVHWRDLG